MLGSINWPFIVYSIFLVYQGEKLYIILLLFESVRVEEFENNSVLTLETVYESAGI